MGKSVKALLKVPKKVRKKSTKALKALQQQAQPIHTSQAATFRSTNNELAAIARQAGNDALEELAAPLQPVLSWFHTGGSEQTSRSLLSATGFSPAGSLTQTGKKTASSLLRLPLKSPPCKRCPALTGNICKCAAKRLG
ncbi:hypothetical protein [uncultured Photobacterium sp.]|uniref:hypothetical protein n=1 Tax=uncultured Photobacterium sp. TaxID=173973 RepID=UPI00262C9AE4|nr:hypothetical protein [uncultured Photobacterium sp.]